MNWEPHSEVILSVFKPKILKYVFFSIVLIEIEILKAEN